MCTPVPVGAHPFLEGVSEGENEIEKTKTATPLMSLFSSVWANYHMLFESAYLPPPTSIILMEPLLQQQQQQIFFLPPLSIQMKIRRCFKITLKTSAARVRAHAFAKRLFPR